MSKWDKLVTAILEKSPNLRFDDLCKALESIGYQCEQPRGGSSHYTFRKSGCMHHDPEAIAHEPCVYQIGGRGRPTVFGIGGMTRLAVGGGLLWRRICNTICPCPTGWR